MIGIISDVHGNYSALSSVLARLDALGVSRIICLGDTAGYYCQVNECCDALRERAVFSVMGNHDWYLARQQRCPRSNSANACLDYQAGVISEQNLAWLDGLALQAFEQGISLVHGGWNDPLDEYLRPSQAYFDALPGGCFASGHTHVQYLWQGQGKVYCNPGSVGQPRDGDPRAAFATWDGEAFELHRVEYDIAQVQQAMARAGFTSYFYENLDKGTQIGGRISAIQGL
ncbi:metallophosphoesterase family protein [Pseudomonas putida]|uniref:metallophosphoesterase family protein n=1 Tax=Pseudomonas TaxID=286 RepID=UPI0006D40584|nr:MULTISPECIES: metallophosphoesterase family protein [Pseudomonas]MBI6941198.1 metallophosphoesterase family protein [Pseudomonas putida]MBI6957569.1 metallophosphoesterase family protein [Pseudomonas putida]PZQ38378.1 MAG: metallophosphoesterase [Pseudomonas putida]